MSFSTPGLHHVSAIAGDPQRNVDCYTDVLGLNLVKQTVNFDEKFMFHLYYGDRLGSPGSLFTCFPFQRGPAGRIGKPQPTAVALAIPPGSSDYWIARLASREMHVEPTTDRFGEPVVRFRDHDGLPLELVERPTDRPPIPGPIPPGRAIRGLHSVTLRSARVFHTAATLEVLGFELHEQAGDRVRYRAPGTAASVVDLLDSDTSYGREGIGTIHHVAFRTGADTLPDWREHLVDAGLEPTWIRDRRYFESIYFREPGGILFELATDEPGFTIDESPESLGTAFQLPPQYESDRAMITQQLPTLTVPEAED